MTYPTDDAGHPQVDFVWGNFPMQPNDERETNLNWNLDNHVIAEIGWSNYPQFIPNYDGLIQYDHLNNVLNNDTQNDGDPDAGLEVVVPDVVRMKVNEADSLLSAVGLNLNNTSHTLVASHITSTGKTVRVSAVSDSWTYGPALSGLRVGDELHFTLDIGTGPTTVDFGTVKVTKINEDGNNSWFEFKVGTAPDPAYDDDAVGTIYGGENLIDVITVQAAGGGGSAGKVKNEGYSVWTRTFTYWDN